MSTPRSSIPATPVPHFFVAGARNSHQSSWSANGRASSSLFLTKRPNTCVFSRHLRVYHHCLYCCNITIRYIKWIEYHTQEVPSVPYQFAFLTNTFSMLWRKDSSVTARCMILTSLAPHLTLQILADAMPTL